jgi:hypothetical protein
MSSSSYVNHIKAIDRLHEESLKSFVSLSQLHSDIKAICDEFDDRWKSQNIFEINPWTFSKTHVIFSVNERIRLAKMIFPTIESNFEEKYHIPPLSEYLLLTCLDQLGQPEEWLPFDNWIQSKKKNAERNKIIEAVTKDNNLEFALNLYRGYQDIYGVKKSFYSFFKKLLTEPQKTIFFSQMEIEVFENYPDNPFHTIGTEDAKIKYLYSVRNNFTHKTKHSGPYTLLWPNHKDEYGWYEKEMVYGQPITQRIKVTDEYYVKLENTVKVGIWEFIRQNRKRHITAHCQKRG